jgi:Kef-type K+ transport system membrane component KefB
VTGVPIAGEVTGLLIVASMAELWVPVASMTGLRAVVAELVAGVLVAGWVSGLLIVASVAGAMPGLRVVAGFSAPWCGDAAGVRVVVDELRVGP